jgi:transcriptional regulator with XRE-family HTH domain
MGRRAVEQGYVGERVAARLKEMRTNRGWSLADVERHMDGAGRSIPRSGISKIESGERRVDVDDLAAFCQVFDVLPSALLGSPDATSPLDSALRLLRADDQAFDRDSVLAEVNRLHMLSMEASAVEYRLLKRLSEAGIDVRS